MQCLGVFLDAEHDTNRRVVHDCRLVSLPALKRHDTAVKATARMSRCLDVKSPGYLAKCVQPYTRIETNETDRDGREGERGEADAEWEGRREGRDSDRENKGWRGREGADRKRKGEMER